MPIPAMITLMNQYGFDQDALPAVLPPGAACIARECLLAGESRTGLEGGAAGKNFDVDVLPDPADRTGTWVRD